uniref:Uncharacterized protein n=1 Tax=Kalanchoe fedtschenkoi TaxID=63787 RepID=A0A7N0V333_KALFE
METNIVKEREVAKMGEEWKKNADTKKMSLEQVKPAGVNSSKRPSTTMVIARLLVIGVIWYAALYTQKKPDADVVDVHEVAAGVAQLEDVRPSESRK